jgi:hypothetical protein
MKGKNDANSGCVTLYIFSFYNLADTIPYVAAECGLEPPRFDVDATGRVADKVQALPLPQPRTM